jgi:hypothetical protein
LWTLHFDALGYPTTRVFASFRAKYLEQMLASLLAVHSHERANRQGWVLASYCSADRGANTFAP